MKRPYYQYRPTPKQRGDCKLSLERLYWLVKKSPGIVTLSFEKFRPRNVGHNSTRPSLDEGLIQARPLKIGLISGLLPHFGLIPDGALVL